MERSMGKGRGWRGEQGTKSNRNDVGQKGREGQETVEEGKDGQEVIERGREGGREGVSWVGNATQEQKQQQLKCCKQQAQPQQHSNSGTLQRLVQTMESSTRCCNYDCGSSRKPPDHLESASSVPPRGETWVAMQQQSKLSAQTQLFWQPW